MIFLFIFFVLFVENTKSKIASYYVDSDRNIPISDVNDIKGKFLNR